MIKYYRLKKEIKLFNYIDEIIIWLYNRNTTNFRLTLKSFYYNKFKYIVNKMHSIILW